MKRSEKTKVIANVRVGKPDASPTTPGHVRGVFEGNYPHPTQRHKGIEEEGEHAKGTARRSTSIRPADHDVIDPRMPKISPA